MKYNTRKIGRLLIWLFTISVIWYFYTKYLPYNYRLSFLWNLLWIIGPFLMIWFGYRFLIEYFDRLQGIGGELKIENILEELPKDFIPIQNLNGGKGNIDHVVIGPTGVWAIETKSGNWWVNFLNLRLRRAMQQALAEGNVIKNILSRELGREILVGRILVFSHPDIKIRLGYKTYWGVYIIGSKWLKDLIQERTVQRLNNSEVAEIAEILNKYKEK